MRASNSISISPSLAGLVLGIVAGACTYEIPSHCSNVGGDATCRERGQGQFCDACVLDNDGCMEEMPGPSCHFVGEPETVDSSSSSGGSSSGDATQGTTSETDGMTSTGSTTTTTDGPCIVDEDCSDVAAPLCDPAGECVSCEQMSDPNAACAGLDPTTPVCEAGVCVQCTMEDATACEGMTPVCDDATNACVGCSAHEQCGEAACNLFTGACLPGSAIVHVGPGQTFTSIGAAVGSFVAGAEGTIIVHQGTYDEPVTVGGGRVLGLLASNGDLPLWALIGGGAPQLTVNEGTVLIDGLRLSNNGSSMHPGMLLVGGQAWLDDARVVGNAGGGITAQGGELVLRNCFVGAGVDSNVLNSQSAVVDVLYSTLGANLGASTAITCNAASTVTVRNSLVVSRDAGPEVVCPGASASHTAAEALLDGTDNLALGDMSTTWFQDYNGGDFHLTMPPISVANAARWEDGDPPADIDNQARPQIDGAPDVAGADVP
ncbi:right-handed parallel beta-helix repeat-containing protein [Paraliomyxa miuraensis]|uniref:hypothetical protein n=1 Tax=Paraliomyxa miuraensis TaxID=376150 RepID=UPI0022568DBC|nr:hypothetical protein [Paraliomyxa miuraensis]MCX4239629.1 hypothetical protein [Paraliomyxa miuraensis]